MSTCDLHYTLAVFPSELGWMAMIGRGRVLRQLVMGHPSAVAAIAALDHTLAAAAQPGSWNASLVDRLQTYAAGEAVDLSDIEVELGALTPFRERVYRLCRQIPFGQTTTYGQLAARAGSPGAARAVGSCMAANRVPLIIPCHRVVASSGGMGGFSGPGGVCLKRRLLELESTSRAPQRQLV